MYPLWGQGSLNPDHDMLPKLPWVISLEAWRFLKVSNCPRNCTPYAVIKAPERDGALQNYIEQLVRAVRPSLDQEISYVWDEGG